MPQLMPLNWILSTILSVLFMFVILKIYGMYIMMNIEESKENNELVDSKWFW